MKRSQVNSWWESLAGKGKREEQVQRSWSLKTAHESAEQQKSQCVWSSMNNGERLGGQEQVRRKKTAHRPQSVLGSSISRMEWKWPTSCHLH